MLSVNKRQLFSHNIYIYFFFFFLRCFLAQIPNLQINRFNQIKIQNLQWWLKCTVHWRLNSDLRLSTLMVRLNTVYFAENWKYYSKIIFKCVNSAVGPIFNKSFVKKKACGSRKQCTGPTRKLKRMSQKKKNKQTNRKRRRKCTGHTTQTGT